MALREGHVHVEDVLSRHDVLHDVLWRKIVEKEEGLLERCVETEEGLLESWINVRFVGEVDEILIDVRF